MSIQTNLMMKLFRILTLEEINELTTSYKQEERVSLTVMIGDDLGLSQGNNVRSGLAPKIIKPNGDEAEGSSLKFVCGEEVKELMDLLYFQWKRRDRNPNTLLDNEGIEGNTSTFINNERKRFSKSQGVLKGAEVLRMYDSQSRVDIETQRRQENKMQILDGGILVNKKAS